jgi:hypothetical protein
MRPAVHTDPAWLWALGGLMECGNTVPYGPVTDWREMTHAPKVLQGNHETRSRPIGPTAQH